MSEIFCVVADIFSLNAVVILLYPPELSSGNIELHFIVPSQITLRL